MVVQRAVSVEFITECVDILRENLCLCDLNIREHS